ncbi:uncharacterized protein LOC115890768 isoform X2 [Sitophilus oryzae]|uniref:Uncharacterized protein LOC115874229 isoform X2 n=1 Tax=Sitophilus oryzae TaxID=7048 RepID=A0A6J2YS89_SITOR|nr:uncharacterized protein LOC115874229 isoform X2 [Sitophilus oryzae]XP_030756226.1 uncharacterized protein LOC115882343 [Sitophilus oryzae]XP_030758631.1 uncharacterized protein LOC115884261 isoform X2 [Sitophilus oryzae]XP_030763842.1 uncharacterized protein LOC115888294 isoform X2 [Sitophilus oryzae]XP_030764523.1 uncharacterized protein LOC115888815 isoform X2 [Sitophilus oryzae]XP_030766718.1 uncharacterized protein LOC115890584 isoform X2 [Sitophilus oryzae]XP_030766958.1 uncharacteriz
MEEDRLPPTTRGDFPGSREIIRQAYIRKGVPVTAIEIIEASISKGTLKQYTSCYKKFWQFCADSNRDPLVYKLETYLDFLSDALKEGLSFSVVNSYRSALNLIFSPISNNDEKVINRFVKGVSNIRPPGPKYKITWDPDPLLKYLGTLYPLEALDLEYATYKLVTLMALTSASRVQTLSLIKVQNINISVDRVEIKIPDRVKTSAPGRFQPLLIFPFFKSKQELCVASTIADYIKRTKPIRNTEEKLILTHKKPHRSASSQTISRWIKNTLNLGGVDTSIFSAHSVRHATTSAAYKAGVNIEIIKNTAGWTPASNTFFSFYNRPVEKPQDKFAKAIIELGSNKS